MKKLGGGRVMTSIKCPRTGCTYETGKVEAVIAAALLTAHSTEHGSSGSSSSSARPPPVDRPKLSAACPKADWEIFKSRWRSFKVATNISGDKLVHQLLGCLDSDVTTLVYLLA